MKKSKKPKARKRHSIARLLYRTLVVISALVVALFIAYKIAVRPPDFSQMSNSSTSVDASAANLADEPGGGTVMVGDKTRKEQCYTFLLAASDDGNGNADTIMVMTYDVPNHKVGVVSIPRDTLIHRSSGMPKINAAYAKGIENLQAVVSDLVGYPIDYYVCVNIKGFQAIVDAVGGVDFYVPCNMSYDDPTQDLTIHFKEGMTHLDGREAMEVARFRKNNDGSGYSDIGRTETQQKLLQTVAKKVMSYSSITKMSKFLNIFSSYVDTDLSPSNMTYFATKGMSLSLSEDVSTATLPGDGNTTYRGYNYCYELSPDESLQILNQMVNPFTTDLTLDDTDIFQVK